MEHVRIDRRVSTGPLTDGNSWALAATVHLPETICQATSVLVCLPGGGYNRHYFDLKEPGYSQAAHHVSYGTIVIAIDHLRVGDSDIPDLGQASLNVVAEANHAVLSTLLDELEQGELVEGNAIKPASVIGCGQSMGGHIALLMQKNHSSFDGLAILGASAVCTRLPAKNIAGEISMLNGQSNEETLARFQSFDWKFAFHWEDVPPEFADGGEAANRNGKPVPYYGSAYAPNAADSMLPGYYAEAAASVRVPVLLGMGERDVCQDPLREVAAFMSAQDLAYFVVKRMAHMHNFAGTRGLLWKRLQFFVDQISEIGGEVN